MKDIIEAIKTANEIYARKRVAWIRHLDEDEEYTYNFVGNILTADGERGTPVALLVVQTTDPVKEIPIVADEFEPGQVPYDALEELAGIVSFSRGRAGILWMNAGHPGILSGPALVNAARRFATNLERVENGGVPKIDSSRVRWDQCSVVPEANHPTLGTLYDWLKACRPDWTEESGGLPLPMPGRPGSYRTETHSVEPPLAPRPGDGASGSSTPPAPSPPPPAAPAPPAPGLSTPPPPQT